MTETTTTAAPPVTRVIKPIAAWKTKSFWLGLVPAALSGVDITVSIFSEPANAPVASAIGAITDPLLGVSEAEIRAGMATILPIYTFITFYQRKGKAGELPRPIVFDGKKAEALDVVQDAAQAFEAGKVLGKAIKGK